MSSIDAVWAAAFARALTKKVKEPEGAGWLTVKELEKKLGLGRQSVTRWLKRETAEKKMDRFQGSQLGKDGNPAPQVWYRPKS